MKKILLIILLGFFLISLISAHDSYYDSIYRPEVIYLEDYHDDYRRADTRHFDERRNNIYSEVDWNYDNEDRYSVYNYRHGYTYRRTDEFKRNHPRIVHLSYDENYYYRNRGVKLQYAQYNPFRDDYKVKDCWVVPPRNQLFYIKCP